MQTRLWIALLVCVLLACEATGNGRVEVMLRKNGWSWVRDSEADFSVLIPLEGSRQQRVVVRQRTFASPRIRTREVLSTAAIFEELPRQDLLLHLLESSATIEVWGHWALLPRRQGRGWALIYMVKIPETASLAQLRAAVLEVAHVADTWERLTSATDRF